MVTTTNAVKAQVLALLNAVLALLAAFGVASLSDTQTAAVFATVNAAWFIFVAATYRLSHKRIPDASPSPGAGRVSART